MASTPFQRDGKGLWITKWQNGRGTKWQICKFDDIRLCEDAKELAEKMKHRITDAEVYKIILDLPDEPEPLPEGTLLFTNFGTRWFKDKCDVDADTLAGYRSLYNNHLDPFFGLMPMPSIDGEARKDWINVMREKPAMRNGKPTGNPLSPTTIGHAHALMHMMCDDAVPEHMAYNPFAQKKGRRKGNGLPKAEVPFEPVYLERWEAELLIRVCPAIIRPLVITALATGLRLGELIPLQVGDLNLNGLVPTITVRRGLKRNGRVGAPKSRKSRRTVTISWALAMFLLKHCQNKSKTALVFRSPMGAMWTESNLNGRYWQKAVAAATFCALHRPKPKMTKRGTEIHDPYARSNCDCPGRLQSSPRIHDLRHTHVGWLLDLHWDFHKIQLRLGHEKVETTMNYYGPRKRDGSPEELRKLDLSVADFADVEDLAETDGTAETEELEDYEEPATVGRTLDSVKIAKIHLPDSEPDPADLSDLAKLDMMVGS